MSVPNESIYVTKLLKRRSRNAFLNMDVCVNRIINCPRAERIEDEIKVQAELNTPPVFNLDEKQFLKQSP